MHMEVNFYRANLLLVCMFATFLVFTHDISEELNIDEYRDFFIKKSLDLYEKESKQFKNIPKLIELIDCMFYDDHLRFAVDSLSTFFYSKNSKKYKFDIYRPDLKRIFKYEPFKIRGFEVVRINDKIWFINSIKPTACADVNNRLGRNFKIINEKIFKAFLTNFFKMYKCIRKISKFYDTNENSYVSIEDITNNTSKKIPRKFQKTDSYLFPYLCNASSVKIESEIETVDLDFERAKMIESFEIKFGKFSYFFYGYYNLYIIDRDISESYEGSNISKISKKTTISLYRIDFLDPMPLDHYKKVTFPVERTYYYESSLQCIKFEYFHTKYSVNHDNYQFLIRFTDSDITFEFNFNWFAACELIKNYTPATTIYVYLKIERDRNLEIVEMKRCIDKNYFRVLNVLDFHSRIGLFYNKNIKELNEDIDLKNMFEF
ncbi:hypothetical protein CWI37_0962p0010 [Hamiltosporidium tvaerminnensis]|uniref:Uncharacterized protein n=1 Tax=Hamiltosporidium tvaerminnensis TaxID=1176355 RepID=A0A4V6MVA5_9MICR|nr:hypothetical protein CWI37_0962p0010 [Hamiltosporidium tvaerminnensis]